jgi:hypothetical protein
MDKVVGTGVFVQPAVVLACVGSKGASLMMWLLGSLVTWAGFDHSPTCFCGFFLIALIVRLTLYLEYGIRFPLTGGEVYYVSLLLLEHR